MIRTSLANHAWESLLTAHATILRDFADDPIWREYNLTMREYDVLYTLAKFGAPSRLGELQHNVLLSQPALSRMVDRLARRGLIARNDDAEDGRAIRVELTDAGREVQRAVGRAHARSVGRCVGSALDTDELHELARLTAKLTAAAQDGTPTDSPAST